MPANDSLSASIQLCSRCRLLRHFYCRLRTPFALYEYKLGLIFIKSEFEMLFFIIIFIAYSR